MAAAIPAGIGVGSSLISGISGKGAAKKQQKLAEQQYAAIKPLIDAQVQGTQFSLGQAKDLYPKATQMFGDTYNTAMGDRSTAMTDYRQLLDQALGRSGQLFSQGQQLAGQGANLLTSSQPYLQGAGAALQDLQSFFRPFMDSGQRAIDQFLPSAGRINEVYASDLGNVNQGYRSASENIASFAPRGGGRVSSLARADVDRQKGLSDIFFQGKNNLRDTALNAAFQGASGQQNVANSLRDLGLGQGQLGLSTIGQGLNTIGTGTQLLGTEGGLAQNAFGQGLQALGLAQNSAQGIGNLGTFALGQSTSGGQGALNTYNNAANNAYNSTFNRNPMGGKGLGGFLVDLFNNKSVQSKINDIFGTSSGSNTRPRTVNG